MKAFHGTRNTSFILNEGFRTSTGGEFGPGIYFSDNEHTAAFYALRVARGPEHPTILSARISLQRPFEVRKIDWIKMTERSTPRTVQRRLVKKGYDSIIGVAINDYERQYILFSPDQVEQSSVQIHARLERR